jgi:hypothetical protein
LNAQVNIDLCSRFSVDHYPYLLWAPPTKFVNAKWNRKQEKSEIKMIHDGRTAERLLKWINKQTERQVSKLFTLTRSSVDMSFTELTICLQLFFSEMSTLVHEFEDNIYSFTWIFFGSAQSL